MPAWRAPNTAAASASAPARTTSIIRSYASWSLLRGSSGSTHHECAVRAGSWGEMGSVLAGF